MSLFKKEDTPNGSPFSADTITLQAIEEARRAMEAQDAKLRQSMFDNMYSNQMRPPPEPEPPTQEELTRTAQILTEVVMLLHAGDWRAAQDKMQARRLPGLPDVAVIDVHRKYRDDHLNSHMQDAMRYGRSFAQSPRQQGKTATEVAMRSQAGAPMSSRFDKVYQDQLNAVQRALLEKIEMSTMAPLIVKKDFFNPIT